MVYAIVFVLSACANAHSVVWQTSNPYVQDTITLLVQQSPVQLTNKIHTVKIPLQRFRKASTAANPAILITIEIGAIETLPDGVFEIYLSPKPPAAKHLESTSSAFINLLDLYAVTPAAATKTITLDVTNQVNGLQQNNIATGYLCFQFKGLTLANGKAATNAGRVWINSIRITR